MSKLIAMLVGEHFHPPAKLVLANLPSGAELILEPEPENPYDASAVKVLVAPSAIPPERLLRMQHDLLEMGVTPEQLMSGGPIMLGHVGASAGKPLAKARESGEPDLVGNLEVLQALLSPDHLATLSFAQDGKGRVTVEEGREDMAEAEPLDEESEDEDGQFEDEDEGDC